MNAEVQQYIRVALFTVMGSLLGRYFSNDMVSAIIGVIGSIITLVWTIYSSRLNGLLDRAKATAGVESISVKVNSIASAKKINSGTSSGVTARSDSERGSA